MSITNILAIATNKTENQVKRFLSSQFGLDTNLVGKGVYVQVSRSDHSWGQVILDTYGVFPNQSVIFDMNYAEDAEMGDATVAQATAELLKSELGDAVLLFNMDTPVIRRIGGNVTLAKEWLLWFESALDTRDIPYTVSDIK